MYITSSSRDRKKNHTLYLRLYTLHPCVSLFPSNYPRGWILMQCILYMYLCGTLFIALNKFSLFPMNYGLNEFFNFNRFLNHVYFSQTSFEVKCFCSASLYINLWPNGPSLTGLETLFSGLDSLKDAWYIEPFKKNWLTSIRFSLRKQFVLKCWLL